MHKEDPYIPIVYTEFWTLYSFRQSLGSELSYKDERSITTLIKMNLSACQIETKVFKVLATLNKNLPIQ
jgi:hypothetical protein